MADNDVRGRFVWYELMTTDTDAAKKFYPELIGWGTQPWEQDDSYTMWTNNGAPLGGLMILPEEAKAAGAPPHWLAYVATPDVDGTAKQATKLGGKVLKEPTDIPNIGRFAVIADPQGAVFAAYAGTGTPPAEQAAAKNGEFSWHELATTDHEAAFKFYNALFGWEKTEAMDMGDAGTYQMYGRKGMTLGGMYNKPAEMPAPPHWLIYAKVSNVDEAVEQVKKIGGQVLNGPMDVPGPSGDRVAQCMDPQGVAFALHSSAG